MKKNLSTITLNAPVLTVRGVNGVNSPQNHKKIEGFDKASTAQSFATKIKNIKDRPKKQTLEDAYVSGLQDQIHYLQMELKLLKDKQIAKHSQVDQLETFFGDGIPINQNILALKNGFNSYKNQLEKKITSLEFEKQQRQHIIVCLRTKVAQSAKKIHEQQKKYKQFLTSKSNITHEKIKKETELKHKIEIEQQTLRNLRIDNRKLTDNLSGMQRAKQLLLVSLMKLQNNKYNKLNKLRESVAQKQKQFQQLGKQYEILKKQEEQRSYVINVEQDNVRLKRKIISLQKQLNALNIKIEEKKMQLTAKLKQRHKEIVARVDMQKRLDATKQAIQIQNNMSIEQLQKIALQRQAKILQKIIDKNKKLATYVDYYGSLLSKVQENIYEMGERKPQLKRQVQIYQNQLKSIQKSMQQQKSKLCQISSQIAKQTSKGNHINQIAPPAIQQIKKQQDRIKFCKMERQKITVDIKLKQKQLQLMEILKCLNLEQAEISNSSNSSLQDRINRFIENWNSLYHNNS